MTGKNSYEIRAIAMATANAFAHKEATRASRKAAKAVRYIDYVNTKLVHDTVYKSIYDILYRESFEQQLVELLLKEMRSNSQPRVPDGYRSLAMDAGRDLNALFGLDPDAQQ